MTGTRLDHAGRATRDPQALHARFEQLGFRVTLWAKNTGAVLPRDVPVRLGTANSGAMLREGYLELFSVTDPARLLKVPGGLLAEAGGGWVLFTW